MHVPSLAFDFEDKRGDGPYEAAFFLSGSAIVVGLIVPFSMSHNLAPYISAGLIVLGIGAYAWLLHRSPMVKYYRAFELDERGIQWKVTPSHNPEMRTWDSVVDVEPSIAVDEGDFHGLKVHVRRNGRPPVIELIPLQYKYQIEQATAEIKSLLATRSGG